MPLPFSEASSFTAFARIYTWPSTLVAWFEFELDFASLGAFGVRAITVVTVNAARVAEGDSSSVHPDERRAHRESLYAECSSAPASMTVVSTEKHQSPILTASLRRGLIHRVMDEDGGNGCIHTTWSLNTSPALSRRPFN
ncbi:hypothetical protein BS47DRAFT_1399328 [Hydnum rufescens UP504]|uniref:Uncharacterized protein n=1 Tax=Hydnum rufescens UP504 TaxID=1448309 RepID=A0A9P6AKU8_9AGAM|nr:hypothetical protein BS47DRAFT_1399328 [Hydnum rufescens UP504]